MIWSATRSRSFHAAAPTPHAPRPMSLAVALAAIVACAASATAQDARQIMGEVQKRADATSQHYEGLLQVINAQGKISDKRWTFDRLGSAGASRSILRFTAPADVKGVALLIVNHPDRASDQWMWTPALQRDRRIAFQDRSTRFFGTDFSYEDLEERDVEQYEYSMEGDETVDGTSCWKIEAKPRKTKSSQYTSSFVWVRRDNYVYERIENFIKSDVVRRLKYSQFEQVQGIWTARLLEMHDLRRNSRTVLAIDKLQYNVPLKTEMFTLQRFGRE